MKDGAQIIRRASHVRIQLQILRSRKSLRTPESLADPLREPVVLDRLFARKREAKTIDRDIIALIEHILVERGEL